MNRGAHGDSSLMLSTLVLSNENRQLAGRREEAPTSQGGGGCHQSVENVYRNRIKVLALCRHFFYNECKGEIVYKNDAEGRQA